MKAKVIINNYLLALKDRLSNNNFLLLSII